MFVFNRIFRDKFKKAAVLLIALTLVAAVFTACGGGEKDGQDGSSSTDLQANTLSAPDLVGKMWNDELKGLISPIKPIVIYDNNSTAPKGQITAQHPAPGTTVYVDSDGVCRSMEITVSNRDFSTKYKSLVGSTAEDAFAWLVECGIKKENVFRKYKASTTGVGNGCVSSFTYDNGGEVPEGTSLKDTDKFIMTINSYTDSVSVPALGGKSFEQAVELLYQCKLNVGEISYEESGFADGTVLSQTPAADETAYYGDTVDLVLSKLAGEFEMPSILGLTLEEAEELLTGRGLKLGTVSEESDREYPRGTVCAQSVKEGETVYAATVIDITIALGGKEDTSVDWDADVITINISENTLLSAGTVEKLYGDCAHKKAIAIAEGKYTWTMPIGTEYPEGDEGLELGLLINEGKGYTEALAALTEDGMRKQDLCIIIRESEQALPKGLKASIDMGAALSGYDVKLYRFDEKSKALSLVSDKVYSVSENGYASFEICGKGIYVAVREKSDSNTVTVSFDSEKASCKEGTSITVKSGDSLTLHIEALKGFVLDSLTLDGTSLEGVSGKTAYVYTLPSVDKDCSFVIEVRAEE